MSSPIKAKRLGWIAVIVTLVLSVILSVAYYVIG